MGLAASFTGLADAGAVGPEGGVAVAGARGAAASCAVCLRRNITVMMGPAAGLAKP